MKLSIFVLFAVVVVASARPQAIVAGSLPTYKTVPVLRREELRDDFGQYSLAYQSADGGSQSSYGVLKPNPDGRGHFLAVTGSYSYTSPDGTPVYVSYEADDKGFRIVNSGPAPVA